MFNRLSLQTAINSLRCKLITLAQICTVCSTHRPAKDTCGLSYFVRAANFKGSRVECSIFSARGGMRVEMFWSWVGGRDASVLIGALLNPGTAILRKQAPRKISACSCFGKSFTSLTVFCQRLNSRVKEGLSPATVARRCLLWIGTTAFRPSSGAASQSSFGTLSDSFRLQPSSTISSNLGARYCETFRFRRALLQLFKFSLSSFRSHAFNLLGAFSDSASSPTNIKLGIGATTSDTLRRYFGSDFWAEAILGT